MNISEKNQDVGASDADRDRSSRRSDRIIWLTVAVLASLLSFLLASPWSRNFSYWAESRTMWAIYFAVGFVLAVYVFSAFFGSLRTLFEHDAIEKAEIAARSATDSTEDQS